MLSLFKRDKKLKRGAKELEDGVLSAYVGSDVDHGHTVYIVGTDIQSSTAISPFTPDTYDAKDGSKIDVTWNVALFNMHALDTKQCKTAKGILVVYNGYSESSLKDLKTVSSPLPRVVPDGIPILVLGVYDSSKPMEVYDEIEQEAHDFCGRNLHAIHIRLDVADAEYTNTVMRHFLHLTHRVANGEPLHFVRAICDNNIEDTFAFVENDVFLMEQLEDANGWALGNYLGHEFYFPRDFVVRAIDEKVAGGFINPRTIIDLAIPRLEEKEDENGKTYTAFMFQVKTAFKEWELPLRYSMLRRFHNSMVDAFKHKKHIIFPHFPRQTMLAPSAERVARRRPKIERYFHWILTEPALREDFIEAHYVNRLVDILFQRAKFVPDEMLESTAAPTKLPSIRGPSGPPPKPKWYQVAPQADADIASGEQATLGSAGAGSMGMAVGHAGGAVAGMAGVMAGGAGAGGGAGAAGQYGGGGEAGYAGSQAGYAGHAGVHGDASGQSGVAVGHAGAAGQYAAVGGAAGAAGVAGQYGDRSEAGYAGGQAGYAGHAGVHGDASGQSGVAVGHAGAAGQYAAVGGAAGAAGVAGQYGDGSEAGYAGGQAGYAGHAGVHGDASGQTGVAVGHAGAAGQYAAVGGAAGAAGVAGQYGDGSEAGYAGQAGQVGYAGHAGVHGDASGQTGVAVGHAGAAGQYAAVGGAAGAAGVAGQYGDGSEAGYAGQAGQVGYAGRAGVHGDASGHTGVAVGHAGAVAGATAVAGMHAGAAAGQAGMFGSSGETPVVVGHAGQVGQAGHAQVSGGEVGVAMGHMGAASSHAAVGGRPLPSLPGGAAPPLPSRSKMAGAPPPLPDRNNVASGAPEVAVGNFVPHAGRGRMLSTDRRAIMEAASAHVKAPTRRAPRMQSVFEDLGVEGRVAGVDGYDPGHDEDVQVQVGMATTRPLPAIPGQAGTEQVPVQSGMVAVSTNPLAETYEKFGVVCPINRIFVKAEWANVSESENELSFEENDTIEVLHDIDENWSYGCANGKLGTFPKNYVKPMRVEDDTKIPLPPLKKFTNPFPFARPAPLDPNRPIMLLMRQQQARMPADYVYDELADKVKAKAQQDEAS